MNSEQEQQQVEGSRDSSSRARDGEAVTVSSGTNASAAVEAASAAESAALVDASAAGENVNARAMLTLPRHFPRLLSPTSASMNPSQPKRQRFQQEADEVPLSESAIQQPNHEQEDHLAGLGTGVTGTNQVGQDTEEDDVDDDGAESAESAASNPTNQHQNAIQLHDRDVLASTGAGRRMRLTLGQKREVVDLAASKKFTHRELAQRFRVGRTTITNICRQEELIRNETDSADATKKKRKTTKCSYDLRILDECLHKWRMEVKVSSPDTKLTGNVLQQKALELASKLLQEPLAEIPDKVRTALQKFSASNGWLDGYRTRFGNFSSKQALSEPNVIKTVDLQTRLREIHLSLDQVEPQDIWTMGEFALQYGSTTASFGHQAVSPLGSSSNGILPPSSGSVSASAPNSIVQLDTTGFGSDWNDPAPFAGNSVAVTSTTGAGSSGNGNGSGCYTVALVVSADGETFDMQVIGTDPHPLQLENVDLQRSYRVVYGHSKTGWQVSHTMVSLLKRLNALAKSRKRVFRVILDSAVPHVKAAILLDSQGDQRTLFVFDHLQLFFVPPNFKTFRYHPCHLGIISSFKARFRYEMLETLFTAYQQQLQVLQHGSSSGTNSDSDPHGHSAQSAQSEAEAITALTQVLRLIKPRNVFHWLHIALESVNKLLVRAAWINSGLLPAKIVAGLSSTGAGMNNPAAFLTSRVANSTNSTITSINSTSGDMNQVSGSVNNPPANVNSNVGNATAATATEQANTCTLSAAFSHKESASVVYESNCFRDLQRLMDDILQHAPELLNALGIPITSAHQLVEMEGNAAVTDPGIDELQILRSVLQKHGYWVSKRVPSSVASADAFVMTGISDGNSNSTQNIGGTGTEMDVDGVTRASVASSGAAAASASSSSLSTSFQLEESCPTPSQVHQSILVLKQFLRVSNDPIENRIEAVVELNRLRSFLPSDTISM